MNFELYESIKEEMKTGDGLGWGKQSLTSATIKLISDGPLSHASMIIRLSEYENEERHRYHTEAGSNGVVLARLTAALGSCNGEVYWYPLKDEWNPLRLAIGRRLLEMMGAGYDYSTLFKMGVYHPPTEDDDSFICSEVLYRALGQKGKIPSPNEIFCEGGDKEYWLNIWKPKVRIL